MSSIVSADISDFLIRVKRNLLAAPGPEATRLFHVNIKTESCLLKLPASPWNPSGMLIFQSLLWRVG